MGAALPLNAPVNDARYRDILSYRARLLTAFLQQEGIAKME